MSKYPNLARAGMNVVRESAAKEMHTLFVRITNTALWQKMVQRLLLAAADTSEWSVDLSKSYYLDKGEVKFLWRLVFRKDHVTGVDMLNHLAIEVIPKVELDSFPLVGRVQHWNSPSGTKGAHPFTAEGGSGADVIVARAFIGGGS